jgi:hypothetical protein
MAFECLATTLAQTSKIPRPARRQSTPIQNAIPIRIAVVTITVTSIVSHQGGSVIAAIARPQGRKCYDLVHMRNALQRALETR